MPNLWDALGMLVPMIVSLSVHEWAHARTALALGDHTARLLGRCTLDPIAHIDPIGTLLLPILGVPFGWAKPVPVDPTRFTRTSSGFGMMLTAIAGPLSNVALAVLGAATLSVFVRLVPPDEGLATAIRVGLVVFVQINVALAIFNLIPVPPLDGSRVADYLMPRSLRRWWDPVYAGGPIALIVLIVALQVYGGHFAAAIGWASAFLFGAFGLLG